VSLTLADVRLTALRVLLAGLPLALFAALVAPSGDGARWAVAALSLAAWGGGPTSLVERSFVGRFAPPLRTALAVGLTGGVCTPVAVVQAHAIGAGWGTAWAPAGLGGGLLVATAVLSVLGASAFTAATYVHLDARRHPPQLAPTAAERWLVRPLLMAFALGLGVPLLLLQAWSDGLERRLDEPRAC